MRIRVRLGAGLSRFADAPQLSIDLAEGASVDDLLAALGAQQPQLAPALNSALPVLAGTHVERAQRLHAGDEVALLIPFTDGLLGPDVPMLGPGADGGHIVVNTTPG